MSAAEAWKYPLWKQSFKSVYTLALGTGIDGDRNDAKPTDATGGYRKDSCAVN